MRGARPSRGSQIEADWKEWKRDTWQARHARTLITDDIITRCANFMK